MCVTDSMNSMVLSSSSNSEALHSSNSCDEVMRETSKQRMREIIEEVREWGVRRRRRTGEDKMESKKRRNESQNVR